MNRYDIRGRRLKLLLSSAAFPLGEGAGHMVGTLGMKRAVILLCAVAAATLVALLAVAANKPAGAATDQLPDLGMYKLTNIRLTKCADTTGTARSPDSSSCASTPG
jgi:hypothetical protein